MDPLLHFNLSDVHATAAQVTFSRSAVYQVQEV